MEKRGKDGKRWKKWEGRNLGKRGKKEGTNMEKGGKEGKHNEKEGKREKRERDTLCLQAVTRPLLGTRCHRPVRYYYIDSQIVTDEFPYLSTFW